MKRVRFVDVLVSLRGRQDDDRDRFKASIFLDFTKNLPPVLPGQIEVQQNQIGPRRRSVFALAVEERHRLDAVVDDAEGVVNLALAQSLSRQESIAWKIFDQQDFH